MNEQPPGKPRIEHFKRLQPKTVSKIREQQLDVLGVRLFADGSPPQLLGERGDRQYGEEVGIAVGAVIRNATEMQVEIMMGYCRAVEELRYVETQLRGAKLLLLLLGMCLVCSLGTIVLGWLV